MHDFHKLGFFQGILKSFDIDVLREKSESEFISVDMCAKLILGDEESINFVGKLKASEKAILEVVNNLKQANAEQVIEESGLKPEDVVDALRSLVKKYFIVEHSDESDQECHYYSFYNYLTKE